jgi:hypothetical protein
MSRPELIVAEVVEVEPTRRVHKRRTVPKLERIGGEKPTYWWSLDVPGIGEFHFVFVSREAIEAATRRHLEAYTDTNGRICAFADDLREPDKRSSLQHTFLHELGHVLLFGMQVGAVARRLLGRVRSADEREEEWCDHLGLGLQPLFDVGVLRLPPLPRRRKRRR